MYLCHGTLGLRVKSSRLHSLFNRAASFLTPAAETISLDLLYLQSAQRLQSLGPCGSVSFHCLRICLTWTHHCIFAVDCCCRVLPCMSHPAVSTSAIQPTAVQIDLYVRQNTNIFAAKAVFFVFLSFIRRPPNPQFGGMRT